ncbi:hypothetical protein TTHERM_000979949 (macronuclear) [Tetrahymena thermophila SB210]|uniref:Uncharacterized protein n=1 Tax=Tetrahymena thermophila (strain SB210) TaxID=312017 RepID=W7XHZ0_TETTS|nr:hypothetical protein TTHERM_000979949 [Tetrahymena thermophila SB210]EWS74186.1 hypothetical protein TTHERM_000979949 [Tetrahymena thermophila SB210]|eukprot:XP_012653278.1 hypothetical protein TTHERM_000979949 [Tetrahymena thermophila SB210]
MLNKTLPKFGLRQVSPCQRLQKPAFAKNPASGSLVQMKYKCRSESETPSVLSFFKGFTVIQVPSILYLGSKILLLVFGQTLIKLETKLTTVVDTVFRQLTQLLVMGGNSGFGDNLEKSVVILIG